MAILGLAGASLAVALLVLSASDAATASAFIEGTNVWTMVGTPSFNYNSGEPMGVATYVNNLNVTVTAEVYMVLHNALGQTVYYTSYTLTLPGGASGSTENVEFGVQFGNYTATFFPITSGIAISTVVSVMVDINPD